MNGYAEANVHIAGLGETREAGVWSRELTKVSFVVPLKKHLQSIRYDTVAFPNERMRHHHPHTLEVMQKFPKKSGVDAG